MDKSGHPESVKERNRRAIVAAAGELASTRGMGNFTVAELADAAGTSRRSIFNHSHTADSAVYAYLTSLIEDLIDRIEDIFDDIDSVDDFLTQLGEALNSDLSFRYLGHVTEVLSTDPRHMNTLSWSSQIIEESSEILDRVLRTYVPSLNPVDGVFLAHAIISAIQTAQSIWAHGTLVDSGSRSHWEALNKRALDNVRHGFADRT